MYRCWRCEGWGRVYSPKSKILIETICPSCEGTGQPEVQILNEVLSELERLAS